MTDPPSYPRSSDSTDAKTGTDASPKRSRRAVIAIWAAVVALFLLMLMLHLTGAVGPGTLG